jgi:hypothetical protein
VLVVCAAVLCANPAAADTYGWSSPGPFSWPQPEGLGTPVILSYSYSNLFDPLLGGGLTRRELEQATEEAFGLWSLYAPLHFHERSDSGPPPSDAEYDQRGHPSIRIGYHAQEEGTTLAHAFLPIAVEWSGLAGDIHLNPDLPWAVGNGPGTIDVLEVMAHEIGHALGVLHLDSAMAIMGALHGGRFSGPGTGFLLPDDIAAIRSIYGRGVGSVHPVPEPATVLLLTAALVARVAWRRRADDHGSRLT